MSNKPSSLINFGEKCYLNSGIQAISACCNFVNKINNISIENKKLKKFTLFNHLIKSVNEGRLLINVAIDDIFNDWNKSGQQDSFELLTHVINEVYEEIRESRGISRGSDILGLKLPLQLKFVYEIVCDCGRKEKSPIQFDYALHLSLPDKKSRDKVVIDTLLHHHFKKEEILNYHCRSNDCKDKITWRALKLYSLPETLCLHFQRLFWNGKDMEKNDIDVSFSNRIIINKNTFLKINDVESNDVHYYLKSIIVHYGCASFGHYICYKKFKDTWYYTSDTNIHIVSAQEVFNCNPYILFYECEEEWQVSPTIIKADNNLNIFINALSSCGVFINWLNKVSVNNDSIIIKRLLYLTDLANGNITRNINFEEELQDWCNKRDIHLAVMDILNEINYDIRGINQDKATQALNFPLLFMVHCKIVCGCGEVFKDTDSSDVVIDLTIENKFRNSQGLIYLQDLIDDYFTVNRSMKYQHAVNKCRCKQSLLTLKLKDPLPDMVCIRLNRWPGDKYDATIMFDNNIILKEFFVERRGCNDNIPMNGKEYFLKSVIGVYNGKICCFRNYNASWYQITKYNIGIMGHKLVLNCDQCILFYDLTRCQFTSGVQYNYLQMSLASSVKTDYMSMKNVIVEPVVIKVNTYLNSFIQAISSCVYFLNELKEMYNDNQSNLERLLYLVSLANGKVKSNDYTNDYMKNTWCKSADNVDELMAHILSYRINNDLLQCCLVKMISCSCGYIGRVKQELQYHMSVHVESLESDLQVLINDTFVKTSDEICKQCTKIKAVESLKICNPLSNTICIKVTSIMSRKITFTETLTIRKEDIITLTKDSCKVNDVDKTYDLKSVITKSGLHCYRKIGDQWYKVKENSSKNVSINDVLKCKAYLLFYECQDLITFDKPLSCILHSFSSCSTIIEWLNIVKNRRNMIKGRFIYDMINIIKGESKEDNQREKMVYMWNDLRFNDIYQLLKIMLQDLEEESNTECGNDGGSLEYCKDVPMKMILEDKKACNANKCLNADIKHKLILNVDLPKETDCKEKVTIQQLLEKYFEKKLCKCKTFVNNTHKLHIGLYPSVIFIHINLFYIKDGESLKYVNNVKPSAKITLNTILNKRRYKLKSVIEHYGKASSVEYCCFKETNSGWVYIKNETIVSLQLEEVLQIEPYIAVYELDTDLYNENIQGSPNVLQSAKPLNDGRSNAESSDHSYNVLQSDKPLNDSRNNENFSDHYLNVLQSDKPLNDDRSNEESFDYSPNVLLSDQPLNDGKSNEESSDNSTNVLQFDKPLNYGRNNEKFSDHYLNVLQSDKSLNDGRSNDESSDNCTNVLQYHKPPSDVRNNEESDNSTLNENIIISYGNISFKKIFNNFLRSILSCPKFILNTKSRINVSDKFCNLNFLFNKVFGLNKTHSGSLIINEDETLTNLAQNNYKTDIEPFADIISLLLEDICYKELKFPFVIFNIRYKNDSLASSHVFYDVKVSKNYNSKVSVQQLWNHHFEVYSNPISGISMLQYRESETQIKYLFKGIFPDTICFNLSLSISMSLLICKPFTLLLNNQLCIAQSQSSSLECSEIKHCDNRGCCRKFIVKSVIDTDGNCYILQKDQWFNVDGSKLSMIDEEQLLHICPKILIYE